MYVHVLVTLIGLNWKKTRFESLLFSKTTIKDVLSFKQQFLLGNFSLYPNKLLSF